MKKILVCLLTLALLFSFTACASISAKENSSEITKADFSKFIARFSDTDTPEGPCYTVNIENINNETKEIEFTVSFVGVKSSPVYSTDKIKAVIADDNTASFNWTDSWKNEGTGVIKINLDDSSKIEILMTITNEAEVNRATLSTKDEYRVLTKR